MLNITRSLKKLAESYIFVLCVALALGFLLPATKALVPYNMYFLQVIFFISSLKLDAGEIVKHGKDWKLIVAANALLLIIFPMLIRLIAPSLVPNMDFALFLLALMPVGMTTPLLVELVGGRQVLALILTITSSLLAPFTVPVMIKFAYGASVHVDILPMFKNLLLIIFMPFIVAMIVKRIAPQGVDAANKRTKPVSLFFLGLVIASAIAGRATDIIGSLSHGASTIWIVVVLYIFFLLHHVIGYYGLWWKSPEERSTISVSLTYMNFTLAIYLASVYFPDPKIILSLVLSILPWTTLLPVWKYIRSLKVLP